MAIFQLPFRPLLLPDTNDTSERGNDSYADHRLRHDPTSLVFVRGSM